ncbi:excinuclease ABC subunit UvrA [Desulforamulus hydrothermalis]|uniref:UvrABC system protein A n=1 Tax=Desulforamulus hydrothermalis Lam5 = DSM 18033 TaxID=1121428 RepID=K8DY38_9FIRM|nr:excinuclease ABC subunit UvrA [Desulforamulus hydrothermalis]CCO07580.1 UvrABC system protein A [Desulforamulus hydrothermalis Lam5 = DSM 18033]SHH20648.1 Excinuclease ABC subunit A [Desulforamulus hydrothermalis Lam5 = DSM 18033]
MQDKIIIRGARSHNLKDIDVVIPRDKLVVITGLSGSGKSSLAFDTIYAEGRRRYVESLSAYARQFLGQMNKPDVDYIEGLSPAISIDQKTTSHNPRSTVGTVTEIYDYLRLLFARVGRAHCPKCGQPIARQTVQQMVDQLMALPEGSRLQLLAPVVRGKKGEHAKVLEDIRRNGFVRLRVNGELYEIGEVPALDKKKKHRIDIVVDRIIIRPGCETRLADSLETALKQSGGLAVAAVTDGPEYIFSENFACPTCGINISEISPRLFSFNNPHGACPACTGLGFNHEFDPDLIIPDKSKSIRQGAVEGWHKGQVAAAYLAGLAEKYQFSLDTPVEQLTQKQLQVILYGTGQEKVKFHYTDSYGHVHRYEVPFEGIIGNLSRRYRETQSEAMREEFEKYMSIKPCPACQGARLKPEALAVKVGDKNIAEVAALPVAEALHFFNSLRLSQRERLIARQILKEIKERLGFLVNVGLDYLTLSRSAGTLSGGEAQRIRLATQIGSGLTGVLYILDEPSIGLHQRDNERLIATLQRLRDLGNTLIVVEHDEDTIRVADHIIDMGPGAGRHGGRVVAAGRPEDIMQEPASLTGQYLSGRRRIPVPARRRPGNGQSLVIQGAAANNLKGIDVTIPLGMFVCVTGVSGSGKSTLINEVLYKALAQKLHRAKDKPGEHLGILGLEHLQKVIDVNQAPIGRTPRSNPATYTGVFNDIRELFAQLPESRARGYQPGRFSFNVKGGRCEACQGDGIIKIEMHFLPDVYVPCEVCKGQRYNRETLEVKYKGKSIADVLDMEVDEAVEFFASIPKIHRRLQTLQDVGLGYIRLGQPAPELSGGEAQRVKLAGELSRRSNGGTIYILDEPTTGLHAADIHRLLQVLHRLVDNGSTVVVIEHNLDVIKTADYIIDLGPEGGDKGGTLVAAGTPEEICRVPQSYTGRFLQPVLAQ